MSNPGSGSGSSPSALTRTRQRGMSNPERGSSQFALRKSPRLLGKVALRRSPRLLGKSAMPMPKRRKISPRKSPGKSAMTMPESPHKSPANDSGHDSSDTETLPEDSDTKRRLPSMETIMRINREHVANHFRRNYVYSKQLRERKTCIHPGGSFSWDDKSSGFTWVAVRGRHVTCVVFKKTLEHVKDRLQRSYLRYNIPETTYSLFGTTAISEIEVLADLPNESHQRFEYDGHVHRPFAIVSVDPNNLNDPVKKDDEQAAVDYLKSELKTGNVCYGAATEEAAFRAFQLLYNQIFEPDDIWVERSFLGEECSLPRHSIKRRLNIINQTGNYKELTAAATNKPDRGGSGSAPEIITNKPDSGGSGSAPKIITS